ncbi:MAG: hypothetical protein KF778_18780 [Rhodocyclaceae bacterium]|nr:hypothetical protein [Rhodocyclaceae bacterium]
MKLEPPFIKTTVQPGDPLTAQAWNDIVNAMAAVYAFLEATEASAVKVQIANAGIDLASVRVTATRDDGISSEAVRPIAPATLHMFPGLRPGNYKLRAEAPGFDAASMDVVVPADGLLETQNLTLTAKGAFMPNVFGITLAEALAQLDTLAIAVNNVLDVTGTAVPVAKPGAQFAQSLVLMQYPPAGIPLAPGEAAQLVISAALQAEASIEMPSLVGLTFAEASKALEAIGLKVGKSLSKST